MITIIIIALSVWVLTWAPGLLMGSLIGPGQRTHPSAIGAAIGMVANRFIALIYFEGFPTDDVIGVVSYLTFPAIDFIQ